MTISEQIKDYQNCRKNSTELDHTLEQASSEFFHDLMSVQSFLNTVPNELSYRKSNIQSIILDTMQSIEQLRQQLSVLNADCNMQIQGLIFKEKRQQKEIDNAKSTNAAMARPISNTRKFKDHKASAR